MQRTNPKIPPPRVAERKVTKQLAGLVDGGFEEGQYEAALASLDQIRSPEYSPLPSVFYDPPLPPFVHKTLTLRVVGWSRPFPCFFIRRAHIRQVTCIALGVPTTLRASVAAPRKQTGKGTDFGGTPFIPDDLPDTFETAPRYSPLPSQQAVDAARTLLFSFAATNSPVSLLRAFPSYPFNPDPSTIRGRVEGADVDFDGEDSVIARVAALSIKSATSVWAMLKPGFVRWDIAVAEAEGKGKGTKRQPAKPKQEPYEDGEDLSAPISERAWPVLEWLISVFERDAEATEKGGKREHAIPSFSHPLPDVTLLLNTSTAFPIAYYSPLLLLTIPGSRNDDPRWDAGAILDVVLFCLSQKNKRYKGSGINLLSQVRGNNPFLYLLGGYYLSPFFYKLISLTSTTRFDLPMFVGAVYSRVPIEDWPSLQTALEYLPDKQPYLHFKLLVYIQYLGQFSRPDGSIKTKRAAPRARGARGEEKRPEESIAAGFVTRAYTIPNWKTTVGPLISASHKGQKDAMIYSKIKYELLVTYASLNNQQEPEGRDAGWDEELHDGSLRRTVEAVFAPNITRDEDEAESVKFLGELLGDILFEV